ncbi:CLIP domain-containing serine protease 14D isoform X2 [Nilaparvata lugens]|uniref:CLIP domain-containing serine protease 14D isoform X2 n=1 Tax=Nilaparvata lugens TaxID=108931 RepID=UPI00193D3C9A|nr:CLIP domain-containing serine protease 14D isoform X2 [Nilaparvata lugens]
MKTLYYVIAVISITITSTRGQSDNPSTHQNGALVNDERCGSQPSIEEAVPFTSYPKGVQRVDPGEYPWVVMLSIENLAHFVGESPYTTCMGSIISKRFVLTASSCFSLYGTENTSPRPRSIIISAGEIDLSTTPHCDDDTSCPLNVYIGESVKYYRDNGPAEGGKNIALVKTTQTIFFHGYVGPICVDYGETLRKEFNGRFGIRVSGWGVSNTDYQQNNKLMVFGDLDIVPSTWSALPDFLPDSFKSQETDESYFLIQTLNETSHKSDTGGPVMVNFRRKGSKHHRYYLYGVFSFETAFAIVAKAEALDVAAKVRYHLKWILDNMYLKDFKLPDKILKLISGNDY